LLKTHDYRLKSHDYTLKTHDSNVKSHDFRAKTRDSNVKSHDFKAKTHDSNVKSHDFKVKTHDSSIKSHDFRAKTCDSSVKSHDFRAKTRDYRLKTHAFRRMLCAPVMLTAQNGNGVKVSNLSVDAGTVTFNVSWQTPMPMALWSDTVWVFVDYNDAGVMKRLPVTGATLTATSTIGVVRTTVLASRTSWSSPVPTCTSVQATPASTTASQFGVSEIINRRVTHKLSPHTTLSSAFANAAWRNAYATGAC
jgi:hypothetical protein